MTFLPEFQPGVLNGWVALLPYFVGFFIFGTCFLKGCQGSAFRRPEIQHVDRRQAPAYAGADWVDKLHGNDGLYTAALRHARICDRSVGLCCGLRHGHEFAEYLPDRVGRPIGCLGILSLVSKSAVGGIGDGPVWAGVDDRCVAVYGDHYLRGRNLSPANRRGGEALFKALRGQLTGIRGERPAIFTILLRILSGRPSLSSSRAWIAIRFPTQCS